MKPSRFTEAQIAFVLRQAEEGVSVSPLGPILVTFSTSSTLRTSVTLSSTLDFDCAKHLTKVLEVAAYGLVQSYRP